MEATEAVLVSREKVELRKRDLDAPHGDQVIIEVVACGVCSSELPVFYGETIGKRGASFRYIEYPCFLGHEISGKVVSVGPVTRTLKVGDRVTGFADNGSGFATHVTESESSLAKVPDNIPLEFALGEPLSAVMNIIRMSEPEIGDSVLLVGDGFMSLMALAALAKYPLKSIIMIGHHDYRLKVAEDFGASLTINTKNKDPYWEVRRFLDADSHNPSSGRWQGGVDIAYEFAGRMSALQVCASLCKPKQRAKLLMASFYDEEKFTLGHYLINRAPSLIPSFPAHSTNPRDDLQRAVWALSKGIFPVSRTISHAFSLDRIDQAFRTSSSRSGSYIKGIVVPDTSKLEAGGSYTIVE